MKKTFSISLAVVALTLFAAKYEIYAPLTGGVAGQILYSAGTNAAPVWAADTTDEQAIINITHPVGSVFIQYTANDNPNILFNLAGRYSSTWDDITLLYDGRYEYATNANAATQVAEEMAMPTFSQIPSHYHEKGTMNITGRFGTFATHAVNRYGVLSKFAFSYDYSTTQKDQASETSFSTVYIIDMDTDRGGWTGASSVDGGHTPSIASPALYKSTAAHIQPMTSTVKIWKRSL